MKKSALAFSTGLLALFLFSGCGSGDQGQEEAIRDLEESFALESEEEASSNQRQTSSGGGGGGGSGQGTASRDTSTNTSSPARDTSQTTDTNSSGSTQDDGTEREVDPVVQEVARETVQMMQSSQYDSAVENLDQLMNSPGLTPAQRSATRRTMAEIQKQIIRDPNISDAEKERIKRVLQRQ